MTRITIASSNHHMTAYGLSVSVEGSSSVWKVAKVATKDMPVILLGHARCGLLAYFIALIIALFIATLCCPGKIFARASSYTVENYTALSGLPQNAINSMVIDKAGFLWISTSNGVCRFDGQIFKTFNIRNTPTFTTNHLGSFNIKPDGGLCVCDDLGIYYDISDKQLFPINKFLTDNKFLLYGSEKLFTYNDMVSLPAWKTQLLFDRSKISNLTIDSSACYINLGGAVFYLDKKRLIVQKLPLDPLIVPFSSAQYKLGDLFFCYRKTGMSVFKEGRLQKKIKLSRDAINISREVYNGHGKFFMSDDKTFAFLRDKLYRLDKTNDSVFVTPLLADISLNFDEIGCIVESKGIIFIGTFIKGIVKLYPISIDTMAMKNSHNKFPSVYDNNNIVYEVAGLADGSIVNDSQIFNTDSKETKLLNVKIDKKSLFKCSDGSLLFYVHDTIFCSDAWFKNIYPIHAFSSIGPFFMETATHVIFAGFDGYIWKLGADKKHLEKISCLNQDIFYLFEYAPSVLWVLLKDGIHEFDINSKQLNSKLLLTAKGIRSVYRAKDKSIWVSTYGNGLYKYVDGRLDPLPMDISGCLENAHNIYEDDNGFFWIPTNKGLIQCLKADLDAYIQDNQQLPFYYRYARRDGLSNEEFNGGSLSPYSFNKKGTLTYPTMNGIVFLRPLAIRPIFCLGNVKIRNIFVDNLYKEASNDLELYPLFHELKFEVECPFFGGPENLDLEYKITPLTNSWTHVNDNKQIIINRLPKGSYELIIRKRNGFGVDNYEYLRKKFVVMPQYYETWWFYCSCTLFLILILLSYFSVNKKRLVNEKNKLQNEVNSRTNELRSSINQLNSTIDELYHSEQKLYESNQKNEKIIAIILHDIRAPVNYMSLAITGYKKNMAFLTFDETHSFLEGFSGTAEKLNLLIQELLNWLLAKREGHTNISTFSIRCLLEEVEQLYSGIAAQQNNIIEISPSEHDNVVTNDRDIIKLIVRNLVDNSTKNTQDGRITISAGQNEDKKKMWISIEDDGSGMYRQNECIGNSAPRPRKLGLDLVYSFLKLINGELKIVSSQGKGTQIVLFLPINALPTTFKG